MPNTKSARKNAKSSLGKRARNYTIRSKSRTVSRKVLDLAKAGKTEEAEKALPLAYKELDMAAKKNVLHKNSAARKKSSLARRVAALKKNSK